MKWIPVEERLPDDGQRIVTIGQHSSTREMITAEITYHDKVGLIDNITHWTSLLPAGERHEMDN